MNQTAQLQWLALDTGTPLPCAAHWGKVSLCLNFVIVLLSRELVVVWLEVWIVASRFKEFQQAGFPWHGDSHSNTEAKMRTQGGEQTRYRHLRFHQMLGDGPSTETHSEDAVCTC